MLRTHRVSRSWRVGLLVVAAVCMQLSQPGPADAVSSNAAPTFIANFEACPAQLQCFVVGRSNNTGVVARTDDGGKTWRRQTLPSGVASLEGIACPTTAVCVAVGGQSTGGAVVLRTSNGGASWTRQSLPSGASGWLFSVACPTTTVCRASGQTSTGNGVVYGTTNSGNTWTLLAQPYSYGLQGISCPSTTTCIAIGFAPSGSDAVAVIYATHDSGKTWPLEYQYPDVAAGSGTWFSFKRISCITTTCVVIGNQTGGGPDRSFSVRTTDGGYTWQSTALPGDVVPQAVRCATVSTCYVAGGDDIVKTIDKGATWKQQSLPTGVDDLDGISCGQPATCYAFGPTNYVATNDGGTTWVLRRHP